MTTSTDQVPLKAI